MHFFEERIAGETFWEWERPWKCSVCIYSFLQQKHQTLHLVQTKFLVFCVFVSILYRWKWNQLLMSVSHHSIDKSFVSWASLLDNASPIAGKAIVKSLPPGLFNLIGAPKLLLPFADWGFTTPDVFCFDCLKERCGVSEDLIDLHTNTQPCIKSSVIGTCLNAVQCRKWRRWSF